VSRILRALLAVLLVKALRRRRAEDVPPPPGPPPEPEDPRAELTSDPARELAAGVLLLAAGLAAACFVVGYLVSGDTQLLGLTGGLAFVLLGLAMIVLSAGIAGQDRVVEERPVPHLQEPTASEIVTAPAGAITRKRLLAGAAGVAGASIGAAMIVPIASLGPAPALGRSPWSNGRRLVGDDGKPVAADVLEVGSFLTAYAEGASRDILGSPVVVVRIDRAMLRPPPDRKDWSVDGILAFSKICTHAGCAVAMLRYPLYPPREPGPALVCPCHYSTFDVTRAGEVLFGPAGRKLPQLPLRLRSDGTLEAAGQMSGAVGPAQGTVDW
jgi:ubiquinol-cytochrome c reductase iron-sulfur subunit